RGPARGPAERGTKTARFGMTERSNWEGGRGRFTTPPPSRPEARSRLGCQSAHELGAPIASSIPEQLPGHEPASARKGYEDGNALVWRYRCVEESFGRHGFARGAMLFGAERRSRLGKSR